MPIMGETATAKSNKNDQIEWNDRSAKFQSLWTVRMIHLWINCQETLPERSKEWCMRSIKMYAYFSDILSNKFQGTQVSDGLTTLFIFAYNIRSLMEQVFISAARFGKNVKLRLLRSTMRLWYNKQMVSWVNLLSSQEKCTHRLVIMLKCILLSVFKLKYFFLQN